jgi:hypothetical protein
MKPRRPPVVRIVLIGIILLGAALVGFGAKSLVDGQRFMATAVEARGVVVDVAKVREYDSDAERTVTRSYPVVQFVTAREQVVRYQPPIGSNPPDYRVGGSLKVLYDPANPQHVVLDTWDDVWLTGVVLVPVGLVLMVVNAAVYLLLRSGRAAQWAAGWLDGGAAGGRHVAK